MTMTLVSTVTVGAGGAASIDFNSVPQTGTDLLVVVSARGSNTSTLSVARLRFNGQATTYNGRYLIGNGSSAASATDASDIYFYNPGNSTTTSTFGNSSIYIPNYTQAVNKSVSLDWVTENNATAASASTGAYLWSSTSAITSLSITHASSGNLAEYSTASLYTITKGNGGAVVS